MLLSLLSLPQTLQPKNPAELHMEWRGILTSSLVWKVNESELKPGQGRLWEEGQFVLLVSGLYPICR